MRTGKNSGCFVREDEMLYYLAEKVYSGREKRTGKPRQRLEARCQKEGGSLMGKLRKYGVAFGVLALFVLLSAAGGPNQCSAGYMWLEASVVKPEKIRLEWLEDQKFSQIRIFRSSGSPDGWNGWRDRKKIATLKGGVKSYTDTVKLNKWYQYEIIAYKKQGKKYWIIHSDTCSQYSGIQSEISWWEDRIDDGGWSGLTTPDSIQLRADIRSKGLVPDGYEVYRSTDGEKFSRIAAKSMDGSKIEYTDRKVESHQAYYYRLRAFRRVRKKAYYSDFSTVQKYTAINGEGMYSVQVLTGEGNALPFLDVCLASEEGNGDLVLEAVWAKGSFQNEAGFPYAIDVTVSQYSYDGQAWLPFQEGSLVLKPGQSIYLRFVRSDGEPLFYRKGENTVIDGVDVEYDSGCSWKSLAIDLGQQRVQVQCNHE